MSLEDITAADSMLANFKDTDVTVADVYMIGERIREWIVESGWLAHQMNTVGRNLGLADEPAAVSA